MSLMQDIGTLRAYLTLDTSQYDKATTGATAKTKDLSKEMGLIGTGGAIAGAGLAAMAAEAIYATNRAGEFADQIKDVAIVTGMSVEQVQQWKHAADVSGVSFDSLTGIMQKFTQNVGATGPAGDELRESLKNMGISVKDANGNFRDTNSLMKETISKLQEIDNPIVRNTTAMKLYGKSWSELADFLEDDVDLLKLMEDAEPISKYDLDKAEEYKNKMGELGAEFDQIQVKIGTKLIPAFSAIVGWITTYGVPAIEYFIDTVTRGINNMIMADAIAVDFLNGLLGNPTHNAEEFAAKLIQENIDRNISMSGKFVAGQFTQNPAGAGAISPVDVGIGGSGGGSSGGSGGGGGGSGSSSSYNWPTSPTGTGVYMIRPERIDPVTGAHSPALYGNATTGQTSTNPYAWNTATPATQISGQTTYAASFGHMLSKLSSTSGLSAAAKSVIDKYYNQGSTTRQASADINVLKTNPNSPEAQAIIARVLKERGPMAGDSSVEGTIEYLESSLQAGSIHDPYIYPTGNDYNALKSEWDRLTGGSQPVLDSRGNAIIYVTIDGQEVAKAVVNKLALLGVKV